MDPRDFWRDYVLPAIRDWENAPLNVRKATIALCELDNLTEHFIRHQKPELDKREVTAERDRLATIKQALGIARDVHDTHKHGELSRRSAQITRGQKPRVVGWGGAIGAAPISAVPIGGSSEELVLVFDEWRPE